MVVENILGRKKIKDFVYFKSKEILKSLRDIPPVETLKMDKTLSQLTYLIKIPNVLV